MTGKSPPPPLHHWVPLLLVLLTSASTTPNAVSAQSIGVNFGTLANNLPPFAQVASFLRSKTYIDRVKLFDANPDIIRAFAGSGVAVCITLPNGDIPSVSELPAARAWVSANVAPFCPATNITMVLVGNEIMATGDRILMSRLVPAMRSLHTALLEAKMGGVRVSTPHSLGILRPSSGPPSSGSFRRGYDRVVFRPMLEFHRRTKSPFVVNPYPYFSYNPQTLPYALFRPNGGVKDGATGVTYSNMFDAQMDAVHAAMMKVGYGDVQIAVGETGWPTQAEPGQSGVGLAEAASYNGGLFRHVNSGKGTPMMPGRRFEAYVFALFNENLKPGPIAERNFGLFNVDFTPVYDAGIMRAGGGGGGGRPTPTPGPGGRKWCIAKQTATQTALQANINYACANGAECAAIQPGGACFQPNTLQSHASFAMNSYYQKAGRNDFNCDFGQTGVVTVSDPSYGGCKY